MRNFLTRNGGGTENVITLKKRKYYINRILKAFPGGTSAFIQKTGGDRKVIRNHPEMISSELVVKWVSILVIG